MSLGSPRLHLRRVDSTNERARSLALSGAPHGTLVTASEQSAGRGRGGRRWEGPPGRALLMSVVLRRWAGLLPLAAGLAVAETIGDQAAIKWPNDVLLERRKVAGILVEGRPQEGWMVLGIGVNVAVSPEELSPELRETAGSLRLAPDAIEPILTRLLDALESWLSAEADRVLTAYRSRDALRGRDVQWAGGNGRAAGIDGEGRLLVRDASGERALDAGEVHLR